MTSGADCVFCVRMAEEDLIAENQRSAAFFDAFPVSPGHALIVPRRHEPDFFSLDPEECSALWSLVGSVREFLESRYDPDGYNLGLNAGDAAGQTVPHVHLHVIPRYEGDVDDPRGGVRHVISDRAAWWEEEDDPDP